MDPGFRQGDTERAGPTHSVPPFAPALCPLWSIFLRSKGGRPAGRPYGDL